MKEAFSKRATTSENMENTCKNKVANEYSSETKVQGTHQWRSDTVRK